MLCHGLSISGLSIVLLVTISVASGPVRAEPPIKIDIPGVGSCTVSTTGDVQCTIFSCTLPGSGPLDCYVCPNGSDISYEAVTLAVSPDGRNLYIGVPTQNNADGSFRHTIVQISLFGECGS
jgi:hypothetical protein